MIDPLQTPENYELFIYTVVDRFPAVRRSTLQFIRRGASLARIEGVLSFDFDVRLLVRQRIVFDRLPVLIDGYGYEVWREEEKLFWYDPQPHPGVESLQATFPHHKHVPPNIKHNRVPAPGLSFTRPNLPLLIQEIEELIGALAAGPGKAG